MNNAEIMVNLIKTTRTEDLLFEGASSYDDGSDIIYGGHLLAQASYSACQTIDDPKKRLHSLQPILFERENQVKIYLRCRSFE